MRIAFDHQIFMHSYGGVARYFARLAQGLSDCEQQVGIFAPAYQNRYLSTLPQEIINGWQINWYPPKTTRLFSAYNQFRSRSQIVRWKPDLVHETYYSRVGSAPHKCATIITVYDMIHELFLNELPLRDSTAAIKRIAIDRADHVLCISENTKSDLMRLYGISSDRVSVVHLGFDQFVQCEHSQELSALTNKPYLLYVGQRGSYKNFIGFLKAVASSNRLLLDFDIVAFGGSKFSAHELDLIASLGFAKNQVQHKSGNDDLLGSFYDSARALVYPSLYEGFGIPPLEAMAHHCPVISSNTSSMPEVIGKAGEYFDPSDTDDIRRAIEAVVYSDSRIDDLKQLGLERLSAFSWDKCTQETLAIYRALA